MSNPMTPNAKNNYDTVEFPSSAPSRAAEKMEEEIDDDTFDYDGGMSQCVSGFGRNTAERIYEDMQNAHHFSNEELNEAKEHIQWSIGELVRWCRHFNRKTKKLELQLEIAVKALQIAKSAFDPEDETPMRFDQIKALEWIDYAVLKTGTK